MEVLNTLNGICDVKSCSVVQMCNCSVRGSDNGRLPIKMYNITEDAVFKHCRLLMLFALFLQTVQMRADYKLLIKLPVGVNGYAPRWSLTDGCLVLVYIPQ